MSKIDPQIEKHMFVFSSFREANLELTLQIKDEEYPREGFADVMTTMVDGSIIEWQLGAWLDQTQMRMARERERLETELIRVFSTIPNTTTNFGLCLVLPKNDAKRFKEAETGTIQAELRHAIQEIDSACTAQPHLQSPQGQLCKDFTNYPTLNKYLQSFMLMQTAAPDRARNQWIQMEGWGGAYTPLTAVEALRKIIAKKAGRYGGLQGVDARLLLHYDEAILYNSPYDATDTSLDDLAELAGHWLRSDFPDLSVSFQEVYLLHTAERCAFQVFPAICKCMS